MKYFLFNYKVLVNDHLLGLKKFCYTGDRMMDIDLVKEKIKALYQEPGKRLAVVEEGGQFEIDEHQYKIMMA
jgi:hypothetical protein